MDTNSSEKGQFYFQTFGDSLVWQKWLEELRTPTKPYFKLKVAMQSSLFNLWHVFFSIL